MKQLRHILEKARRVVMRKGIAAQDADDLVQSAYARMQAYEQKNAVRSQEALLITTAVRLAYNERKRQHKAAMIEMVDELPAVPDANPLPDEVLRAQQRVRRLTEGLDRLPERTRRILLSRRLDGLTYKEIARIEGSTEAAIEKQVARATMDLINWVNGW
ncbi:RNA polymerase sigma factor [Asticcacaulis sp. BYS171W]|uniref:RNA polymerase sigma factor n=1 Tax=Asticcacaulis aquaticus TaxID=2984212 RepID=A0ABT5HXT6_9CAUL|nr:RNA polymerase sigma factor [Asticcacaulis aquaticus]MDC7684665.1 RNA polymerase sigma factor [Asticcacaulis aquaticus]